MRLRRADDRLRDRRALDHLLDGDQELLLAVARARERLERDLGDVESLRVPRYCRALDRLEDALAEEARAALFRRRAGDVRHTFEPHVALRAVHLEAEAAAR